MSFLSSDLDNLKLFFIIRNRRRVIKRIRRRREPCIIICDNCTVLGIVCLKISSDKRKLIYAECRRKGIPCVFILWNAVERAINNNKNNLLKAQAEVKNL